MEAVMQDPINGRCEVQERTETWPYSRRCANQSIAMAQVPEGVAIMFLEVCDKHADEAEKMGLRVTRWP